MTSRGLRELLRERTDDVGQEAVAQALDVSQGQVSKWISGPDLPRDDRVEALASLLGQPVDAIVSLLSEARRQRTSERVPDERVTVRLSKLEGRDLIRALRAQERATEDPEERARIAELRRRVEETAKGAS